MKCHPDLEVYRGNYSAYLVQREERYRRLALEYEAQREFVEKEEDYIRRNMAGQNTTPGSGTIKTSRNVCWQKANCPGPVKAAHCISASRAAIDPAIWFCEPMFAVGYADEGRPLFHVPDLIFTRLECAAIIGPNGAGKTTFLKTILNQIPPYSGEVDLGASLTIGYFAQAHEGLVADHNLVEEIESVAPSMLPMPVFAIIWPSSSLLAMMFSNRSGCFPVGNAGGWLWRNWRYKITTCCYWMSQPIT